MNTATGSHGAFCPRRAVPDRPTSAVIDPVPLGVVVRRFSPASFAERLHRYASRNLRKAVEGRRMNRIRRNPHGLRAALTSARSVLIVCHGNIIRSAFAAKLLGRAIGDDARVTILSGGLGAVPGSRAHPMAIGAGTALGVDLSGHASAALTADTVAEADVIFVMELDQLVEIRRRFPAARGRTFLLTCLTADGPLEIRDPIDGDEIVYERCFNQIVRAVGPIASLLDARPQEPR